MITIFAIIGIIVVFVFVTSFASFFVHREKMIEEGGRRLREYEDKEE